MYKKVQLTDEQKHFQHKLNQEKELKSLARQYLILDRACSHSQFSRGSSLIKGDKVVAIFQKEHENILNDLTRAAAPGRIRECEKVFDELAKLMEENTLNTDQIYKYKMYIKELEDEIKVYQKSVHHLSKQQTSDRQCEERVHQGMKTVEALENKLETQMIQFGTICTKNKQLRDEIDHHLWERRIFIKQWESLIEKLSEGKQIMLDLIEQATIAYNQREEWCNKLNILRTRAHIDFITNSQEMRELKRRYDNNEKLRDFFWIKGQRRIMKDLEAKEQEKRQRTYQVIEEKVSKYDNMLHDIKNFCRQKKLDGIAKNFAKQEEFNLSNFRFIIDTIRDMEAINDKLGFLHIDIEERSALHEAREYQQKHTIEETESDFQKSQNAARESEKQLNDTQTHLQTLLQGITTLFQICKCKKDPLIALLGDNTSVKFYNVDLYLKILETRIHEMLITAGYKDKTSRVEAHKKVLQPEEHVNKIFTIEQIVTTTPCSLCVEHDMVSDVIDVLQRVWTRSEAKKKLKQRLKLPEGTFGLHTISHCQLPKARGLIQRRYE